MALTGAVLRQATDLMTLTQSIAPGFSVGSAVGAQLDAVGNSFFIPRQEGWDDETYRAVLLRKLKRNTWDGSNESVQDYLLPGESVSDNNDGTVTVVATDLPLPAEELLPIPVGVRVVPPMSS